MADLVSQPTSIQSAYTLYRDARLYANRRYQRKLVWTLEEKQKLVESILKKYPIPAILIAEREGAPGSYEIIDGLQRLQAIMSFIETSFPTLDGRFFNLQFFPTAKEQSDKGAFSPKESNELLNQREVGIILDYTLALSVMRNATDAEVNDVFSRINTYGHRLSDQERRQAGVENEFSSLVRTLACTLRGDATADVLLLQSMPSISIDLPMTKHGYAVQAEDVFWVNQGILRSTDLRDSMDEQCIADISACIAGGQLIERSKDALDEVYRLGSAESERIANSLDVYGGLKLAEEFKFCIDELINVCGPDEKLRDLVFKQRTTNAFPSVFAILLLAFHELIVGDEKRITDYPGVKGALRNITERIDTGRRATSPEERRKNIDTVKVLIGPHFIKKKTPSIYGNHATTDIESAIRRSEIELSDFELKQGLLELSGPNRKMGKDILEKIFRTICAIANNGPKRVGKLILGVADKTSDVARIKELDGVDARKIGRRYVVGVVREAKILKITNEQYYTKLRDGIRNSAISDALKQSVLSSIDYNAFYGLGVVVITVPAQKDLSYYGDSVFWRDGDTTREAKTPKEIALLAKRF